MSDNPYYIVSHVRKDGGARETTYIGYGAERAAYRDYGELTEAKAIRFVQMVQRIINGPSDVDFNLVASHTKPGETNPK